MPSTVARRAGSGFSREHERRKPAHGSYTLVAVPHDLDHACRYADHIIAMRDGTVIATGPPREVVTADLVEHVFGLPCRVIDDPVSGTPLVIPLGRRRGHHTPADEAAAVEVLER